MSIDVSVHSKPKAAHMWGWSLAPLLLVYSAFMFFPSAFAYFNPAYSQAEGTLAAAAVAIGVGLYRSPPRDSFLLIVICVVLVIVHLVIAALMHDVDVQRALLSTILLVAVGIAVIISKNWIFTSSETDTSVALHLIRLALLVIALASLAGIQPYSVREFPKPIYPFGEPSHFALVFIPLLIHACVTSKLPMRLLWIGIGLALAYLLENLTLVVGVAIAAALSLPISFLLLGIIALASLVGFVDTDYFVDRLDFSAHTNNLSALVYLQGWDIVTGSLEHTGGWGFGFQQLGFVEIRSAAADKIVRMWGSDTNLADGGFTAAKLIGEFGFFGLSLVLAYLFLAVRVGWLLRVAAIKRRIKDTRLLFAYSIISAFSVDLFVRGTGYFSASPTLVLVAVFYIIHRRGALDRNAAHRRDMAGLALSHSRVRRGMGDSPR